MTTEFSSDVDHMAHLTPVGTYGELGTVCQTVNNSFPFPALIADTVLMRK